MNEVNSPINTHLQENARLAREQRFAYKVRQSLNEAADTLPADKLEQLAAARKAALRAHVYNPAEQVRPVLIGGPSGSHTLTSSHNPDGMHWGRLGLGLAALLLVAVSLIGIFHVEQQQRIDELANVDTGVLTDELPISAYADHGFNAYLKQVQASEMESKP